MNQSHWTISVNGEISHESSAKVSVLDRGFLFGDSVYEVSSTFKGVLMFWEDHYERLLRSAAGLGIEIPWPLSQLKETIYKTIEAHPRKNDVYVRLIITRGVFTDIGLFPKTTEPPTCVVLVQDIPPTPEHYLKEGIRLFVAEKILRNLRRATDPNLKTGNYLNSVLAIQEAKSHGFDDAIMLNKDGYITEGTTFNIWGVKNKVLMTAPLDAGILLGITRKKIFEIAHQYKIQILEKYFSLNEFLEMDEVFTSSSVRGLVPVGKLNSKTFTMKSFQLFPELQKHYKTLCESYLKSH